MSVGAAVDERGAHGGQCGPVVRHAAIEVENPGDATHLRSHAPRRRKAYGRGRTRPPKKCQP